MFNSLKHMGHFIKVGRTLAKHDALFLLDGLAQEHTLIDWGRNLLFLIAFGKETKNLRPGQRLANALQSLGPAYIKLGQTLATRPDLIGDNISQDLAELQDKLPSFSGEEAIKIIEKELNKPLNKLFKSFEEKAVAAASIAQVHFGKTIEGKNVAIKILRPNIEKSFQKNIQSFYWAAKLLERNFSEARRLRPVEIVKTLDESVAFEMDLRLEAAAASELKENMQGQSGYRVPEIYWDKTSRRVLTLEKISGTPIGDSKALKKKRHDLKALSQKIVHIFLTQSIGDGFFHADLHQGNLFVEKDGTIVPVDFGIMGRLDKRSRRFLAEILWGFQEKDYTRVAQIHFDAGYVDKGQSLDLFAQAMRAVAEPIMDKPIQDVSIGQLLAQLLATTRRFSMKTQPQLLMLQRSMVMAEGLAYQLNSNANMWELSRPTLETWIKKNLGPEQQLKDISESLLKILKRLPHYLETIDQELSKGKKTNTKKIKVIKLKTSSLIFGILIGVGAFYVLA